MGWEDAWIRRTVLGLLGALLLIQTGRAAVARRARVLSLLFWAAAGVAMLALAFFPVPVLRSIMGVEYVSRVRFIMGAVSLLVLIITVEAVRREHLQERYALLWILTSIVMLSIVLFPNSMALFRAVTGMDYATAMAAVAFIFLVLVAFHFSMALSSLQSKLAKLSQQVAMLEAGQRAAKAAPETPPADAAKTQ
jgi:hypothetical protein